MRQLILIPLLAGLMSAPAVLACGDCAVPGADGGGAKDLAQVQAAAQQAAQQPWTASGTALEKKDPVPAAIFLQEETGREIRLAGPLAVEVGRLVGGARVEVSCRPPAGESCEVLGYDILATESGRRPLVGEVIEEGGQLFLRARLPLSPAAEKALRPHLGEKIYLEGTISHARIGRVRSLGVLYRPRTAPPAAGTPVPNR